MRHHFSAFRFTDFRSDTWRESPNRSRTTGRLYGGAWLGRVGSRQIDAHHGRRLGKAVPFKNFFVKAFLKMIRQIERQFFGSGNDEPQALELLRFGLTQIQPEKSGGQKQEREFISVH